MGGDSNIAVIFGSRFGDTATERELTRIFCSAARVQSITLEVISRANLPSSIRPDFGVRIYTLLGACSKQYK
jgi:hypothetical protein